MAHIGMPMMDALSLFRRQLVEEDKRRGAEMADQLLRSDGTRRAVFTTVESISPSKEEIERQERMERLTDSFFDI